MSKNQLLGNSEHVTEPEPLKACPFCGETRVCLCETEFQERAVWAVSCCSPDCHGAIWSLGYGQFKTKQQAIAAWNTRPAEDRKADEGDIGIPATEQLQALTAERDALRAQIERLSSDEALDPARKKTKTGESSE